MKELAKNPDMHAMLKDKAKLAGDALRGKPKEIVQCPYCEKTGGKPAMKRHHFENCKGK